MPQITKIPTLATTPTMTPNANTSALDIIPFDCNYKLVGASVYVRPENPPAAFLYAEISLYHRHASINNWMRLQTRAHRLMYPFTRFIYRHADAIVVYGEHVKRYLSSEEGVPTERIFVAAHAVDNPAYNADVPEEDKTQLRRDLGIRDHQKVILYLGRLEEIKGLRYLLEAF